MRKNAAANTIVPFTEVVIDGRALKCTFDYDALAAAEDELAERGHAVNILLGMLTRNFSGTRALFAASLLHYQPEIPFETAQRMVRPGNLVVIMSAINRAWQECHPPASEERPQEAEGASAESNSGKNSTPSLESTSA